MNRINKTNCSIPKTLRKPVLQITGIALISTICIVSAANAYAFNNENDLLSSRSLPINYADKAPKQLASRTAIGTNEAQQAGIDTINQLIITSLPRKTRDEIIAERKQKLSIEKVDSNTLSSKSAQSFNYVEFSIYGASSRLFEDFDYDGFYRTFSVTFDADVHSQYVGERASVIADLYLSRDNGPWELYFTTDVFTIVDDISDDEFEVLTTLDLGYKAGHYDVLIDLYEVGYSDIVATISSEDVDDLYALPLESAERDEYVAIETHGSEVMISGGGISITGLLILLCAIALRFGNLFKHNK